MIVIADTSPLNYLIRLGLPDILRDIYGEYGFRASRPVEASMLALYEQAKKKTITVATERRFRCCACGRCDC
jgi:hypothetical protein